MMVSSCRDGLPGHLAASLGIFDDVSRCGIYHPQLYVKPVRQETESTSVQTDLAETTTISMKNLIMILSLSIYREYVPDDLRTKAQSRRLS